MHRVRTFVSVHTRAAPSYCFIWQLLSPRDIRDLANGAETNRPGITCPPPPSLPRHFCACSAFPSKWEAMDLFSITSFIALYKRGWEDFITSRRERHWGKEWWRGLGRRSGAGMAGAQALRVGLGWGWDGDSSVADMGLFWLVPPSRYHALWCPHWGQSCKNHTQYECIAFLGETAKCSVLPNPQYSFESFHRIIQISSILLRTVLWQGFLSTWLDWALLPFPSTRQCPHSPLTVSSARHPAAWSHAHYVSYLLTFCPVFSCSYGQRPRSVHTPLSSLLWGAFSIFSQVLGLSSQERCCGGPGWLQKTSFTSAYSHWGNLQVVKYIYKPVGWGLKLKLTPCIALRHFAQIPEGRET